MATIATGTLDYVRRPRGFQLQSWSCICIFFADLLFRFWYIPQDTCRAENSFRQHQTHPYFPSYVMSGCKLAHFIVSALAEFDMTLTSTSLAGHPAAIQSWSQDIKISCQYAVDVRWGVTPPLGINDRVVIQPRESLIPLGWAGRGWAEWRCAFKALQTARNCSRSSSPELQSLPRFPQRILLGGSNIASVFCAGVP